jgi:hypothetical protein
MTIESPEASNGNKHKRSMLSISSPARTENIDKCQIYLFHWACRAVPPILLLPSSRRSRRFGDCSCGNSARRFSATDCLPNGHLQHTKTCVQQSNARPIHSFASFPVSGPTPVCRITQVLRSEHGICFRLARERPFDKVQGGLNTKQSTCAASLLRTIKPRQPHHPFDSFPEPFLCSKLRSCSARSTIRDLLWKPYLVLEVARGLPVSRPSWDPSIRWTSTG